MTRWTLFLAIFCFNHFPLAVNSFATPRSVTTNQFKRPTHSRGTTSSPLSPPLETSLALYSSIAPQRDERNADTQTDDSEKQVQLSEAVPKNLSSAVSFFLYKSGNPAPLIVLVTLTSLVTYYARYLPLLSPLSTSLTFLSVGAFWIVQEYFLHRFVLHSSLDWAGKDIHQGHHSKPYYHNSIDPPLMILTWMATAGVLLKLLLPNDPSLWIVSLVFYSTFGLWYEFLHFLSHTRVPFTPGRGVGGYFHKVKSNHIRHHRVDSDRWFTFTAPGSVDEWWGSGGDVRDNRREAK